jgi:O-antigen/teichoic acid export membrane protein
MIKRNLIANYLGQGWTAIMSILFVPWYIKYLGIEAYGLIGIFALLQAWLTLLDMGMTPTLGREMARFTGGAHNEQSIRDLLRSIEIIALGVACLIVISIWISSTWLAADWLRAEKLPIPVVARAFNIMGVVTALRFIEGIYRGSLVGLQRQVHLNAISSIMATLRGLGAVGVLAWVSPSIGAFFLWQGAISVLTLLLFARETYAAIPPSKRPGRFSLDAIKSVWSFSSGMMGYALLSLLLTQADKVLLSRMLLLGDYGYYTLAAAVAGMIFMLTSPVTQAFLPHLNELHARRDETRLIQTFHKSAQLVAVIMGSAGFMLVAFSGVILSLWTHDPGLAKHSAPLLSALCLGNILSGIMWVLLATQSAYGWLGLTIRISLVSVVLYIPAILWVTPRYGAQGAAWTWVILNSGSLVAGAHFMFRKILTSEKWRWYTRDVLLPLTTAGCVVYVSALAMPQHLAHISQFAWLFITGLLALLATMLVAETLRSSMKATMKKYFQSGAGNYLRGGIRKVRRFLRGLRYKVENINGLQLAYDPKKDIFTREYYFYCVELFRKVFSDVNLSLNVIFGGDTVKFWNSKRTLKIDMQLEHTLVKPGGRDSSGAVAGKIPIKDRHDFYLARLQNYDYLKTLDWVIEYSIPNMVNVRESGLFEDYCMKVVHVAPLLYDMDFNGKERTRDAITLFHDVYQPRRKFFLDKARELNLPLENVRGLFDKTDLKQLYKKTKILVNIHQTDHHDTFEELRILPALLCGVVIVSEDVPLKEHVPYSKFIVWSSYENMAATVKSVCDDYGYYFKKIFEGPELSDILMRLKKNNTDNVVRTVRAMAGKDQL